VLGWAGNWVIGRALRFEAPPAAITFWRWAIALAVLMPFTYPYFRKDARLVFRSWKLLCSLGLLATVLQHIPIYIGLRYTTATNGALLNATAPILILLLAALVGDRLSARALVGGIVSIGGVLTVISGGDPAVLLTLSPNVGDVWVLIGTLSWAAYTVALRWWPPELRRLPALTVLAGVGVCATAPFYAFEISQGQSLSLNAATITGIAYIGVIATVVGYIFWNSAVERVGPGRAGPFMYLMLVFTPLLSIIFLDERLYAYHLVGATLIVTGIVFGTTRRPLP
jgi:drug/metabolite transporter (DMT)-like permease